VFKGKHIKLSSWDELPGFVHLFNLRVSHNKKLDSFFFLNAFILHIYRE